MKTLKTIYPEIKRVKTTCGTTSIYGVHSIGEREVIDGEHHYRIDDVKSAKWSGSREIPALGEKVEINFNGFGKGTVVAYFTEAGYIGIEVALETKPDWYKKQKGTQPLVFGAEIL